MSTKVENLSGRALDYAVAIAMKDVVKDKQGRVVFEFIPRYSTWWGVAGGVIDQEHISTSVNHNGVWIAWCSYNYNDEMQHMQSGKTAQEAAMRCAVKKLLGDVVEIPTSFL